jgi:hypothetical protein
VEGGKEMSLNRTSQKDEIDLTRNKIYHVKFKEDCSGELEMEIIELDLFLTIEFYLDEDVVGGQVELKK